VTQRSETEVPFGPSKGRAGWLFTAIWLIYLAYPLGELFRGHPSPVKVGLVLGAAAVFCFAYVRVGILSDRDWDVLPPDRLGNPNKLVLLGLMAAVALVLSLTVTSDWMALWIYVASACGIALPLGKAPSWAMRGGLAVTVVISVQALAEGARLSDWLSLLLPCVFSCLGVIGIRGMHELIRQLQMARAEVARLAAGEERLRMARDLHDLAGHSLATITLKAELSRKLLRVDQDRAEQQIFDLEHVSRQALADIREAVSGYRRATLAVESASARTALRAAEIEPDIDPSVGARSGSLDPEAESALAWCLREAVTNVVRHSGARTCRIRLIDARVDGAPSLTLEVLDDGPAAPDPAREGNGLAGLRERLGAVSAEAVLTAGPVPSGGFRLTATVPARLAA
jgi:two-component system sensor histidine kinase DesK